MSNSDTNRFNLKVPEEYISAAIENFRPSIYLNADQNDAVRSAYVREVRDSCEVPPFPHTPVVFLEPAILMRVWRPRREALDYAWQNLKEENTGWEEVVESIAEKGQTQIPILHCPEGLDPRRLYVVSGQSTILACASLGIPVEVCLSTPWQD